MKHAKGKLIAILAGALGAGVLLIAALVLRQPITEEWYIRKLSSEDFETCLGAARSLSALESARAIPALIHRRCEFQRRELDEYEKRFGNRVGRAGRIVHTHDTPWTVPMKILDAAIIDIVTGTTRPAISSLSRVLRQGSTEERRLAIDLARTCIEDRAALLDDPVFAEVLRGS